MTEGSLTGSRTVMDKNRAARIAVTVFYFCQGICFSSWASRIPDIKTSMGLTDAGLGTILFALPLGQLVTMPFSGLLVNRLGSRKVMIFGSCLYAIAMTNLGWATQNWQLWLALFIFGVVGNMSNIAVNTQGIAVEKAYERSVMASFHGAWSAAGFTGALIGLLLVHYKVGPHAHFIGVAALVLLTVLFSNKYLLDTVEAAASEQRRIPRPDKALVLLGIIGFCSMASEGAMFDWSGVYFKDVVKAPESLVILGYTAFMIMMATGRFVGDALIARIGRMRLMQLSGVLISAGLLLSVIFPHIITATIAFMIVGLGVSSVVPGVFSEAGKSVKVSPGTAVAMVSSISFLGFLLGPPLIGYVAALFSLRYSFAIIAVFGICITILISRMKPVE